MKERRNDWPRRKKINENCKRRKPRKLSKQKKERRYRRRRRSKPRRRRGKSRRRRKSRRRNSHNKLRHLKNSPASPAEKEIAWGISGSVKSEHYKIRFCVGRVGLYMDDIADDVES